MTVIDSILQGLGQIGSAFFYEWSMWWIMAPILSIWLILEIYFGQFKKEKLGWNTSLANGISMLWILIEALRFIFSEDKIDFFWLRFLILGLMLLYAIFIIYISFSHQFSPKITYGLAAPTPIYFFSVMAILWSHGRLNITLWVLWDMILLFLLVLLFFYLVRRIIPESEKDEEKEEGLGKEPGGFEETPGLGGGLGETGGLGDTAPKSDMDIGAGDFKL